MKLVTNRRVVMFADVHAMGVTLAQLYHITDNARGDTFHKKMCHLWNHLSSKAPKWYQRRTSKDLARLAKKLL